MTHLWLASWYPHAGDPFNGDFVQRHALAVSLRAPVTVVHVARGAGAPAVTQRGRLTEHIYYSLSRWRALLAYDRAFRAFARSNGRPAVIHVHVCMIAGVYALWARWRYRVPFVVTEHYSIYATSEFLSKPWWYRWVNRRVLARASAVHSVSAFLLERMRAVAPLRRTMVIPNVVDTRLFRPGNRHAASANGGGGASANGGGGARADRPFRFIHVSSFIPLKNVPGILQAFAKLAERRRDWELVLVGPADEDTRAKGEGLPVRWTGEVAYRVVAEWMRQSDALVHFSWVENQPCVISEALCCGLPVVAPAIGGIPEAVDAGNGLLVPARDVGALAAALERVMEMTWDHEAIAQKAAALYDYERVGEALEAFAIGAVREVRNATHS
ncbi:MAG TPA: glycosyltransferase [Dinghuibacter sp.]|uniref:glycosyltransferase n=1 Tax=Dinghuibacter sp. TaxID=2024697 RepID=UPI002C1E478C|nr:glycosyltransferase [Dinghuibacter sp.]HTJ11079.1 glycosyltransferase [Dinghuibacter sp.]